MGVIDVRSFNVATHFGTGGYLEVADIWPADEAMWDINLAALVEVNALAVPADRELIYPVMQHELQLLLSFLVDQPGNPLTLRHDEFQASSGHVKRFISESFGLGMLTAAAERRHRWRLDDGHLRHFDVLSAKVRGSGIRPDLLFDFTGRGHSQRLAGEARGRSSVRPVHFANKEQRTRLADIVAWSGANDLHPVTMTYAYTGSANAQVDLFDIAAPDYSGSGARKIITADVEDFVTIQTERHFERLAYIRPRALERVNEIADQLYETAPQDASTRRRSVYGRNVRGSWATADLVAPSRLRFFLGLLDQSLTPEEVEAPRHRRNIAEQEDTELLQVATTGRILVVVARDAPEDPDWSEVTGRIE